MTARAKLSAAQVESMIERLRGRLEKIVPETQPEIAKRILELVEDPESAPADFAVVIKHDPSLCGRILRVANSALFAQRNPVTTPERACMLLGLQRIRGITLGFYLAKASQGGPRELSRRIWGESVFRGCVASMLATRLAPQRSGEAFLIGLMIDTGVPLLRQLVGPVYGEMLDRGLTPQELYREEFQSLPCTHVDVISALARTWELPDALRKPIERHHVAPAPGDTDDEVEMLHRIAFFVGSLDLTITDDEVSAAHLSIEGSRALGLSEEDLRASIDETVGEYETLIGIYSEIAEGIGDVDALRELTHRRLSMAADELARTAFAIEGLGHPEEFAFSTGRVRVEVEGPTSVLAVLLDSNGDGIVSYRFNPTAETAATVVDALGLDIGQDPAIEELGGYLRNIAA